VLRILTDQNFDENIVSGLLRRGVELEILRARELSLDAVSDPETLEAAAEHDAIVLSHDRSTLAEFAWGRVGQGLAMPGVVTVPWEMAVGDAVRALEPILGPGQPADFRNLVWTIGRRAGS
jgi:Domain of unknown function (DUF5615)